MNTQAAAVTPAKQPKKAITSYEAAYLKHEGELNDVKVSLRIVDGHPVVHIRDFEHETFQAAREHLVRINELENVSDASNRDEVAS